MKRFSLYLISVVILGLLIALMICPRKFGLTTLAHTKRLLELQHLTHTKEWEKLETSLRDSIKEKQINERDLRLLASTTPDSPLEKACAATDSILSLPEKTGLNFIKAFPIALFAETSLKKEIGKNRYHWSEERFGREIQVNPKTKQLFIHLGTHGVKRLGKGKYKVVTKTLLYDETHPELMARGIAQARMRKERKAMKKVHGLPGVIQAESVLKHKDPVSGKSVRSIITKIYNLGALKSVLDSGFKFCWREKLQLALDITTGLASMHSKGIAHRDLSSRNYFVKIEHPTPSTRSIRAVVADLGRAMPTSHAKNVSAQGNSSYLAPEAFFRKKMKGKDYLFSDIFALGCVLWEIYFGTPPKWRKEKTRNKFIANPKKGCEYITSAINELRNSANSSLEDVNEDKRVIIQRFLSLILKMTNPIASKRGTASSVRDTLSRLLEEYDTLPITTTA